jgi:hypothetical protein
VAESLARVIGRLDIFCISRQPMCGNLNVSLKRVGAALDCCRVRDIVPRSLNVSLQHRSGWQVGQRGMWVLLCDGTVSVPMNMLYLLGSVRGLWKMMA